MAVRERAGTMVIPHHARGARLARQRLSAQLRELLPSSILTDAVVVVAELLGNAVRHAEPLPGGVIRLAWRVSAVAAPAGTTRRGAPSHRQTGEPPVTEGVLLQVRVTDGGSTQAPGPRAPSTDSVDGRGLAIVAALAQRWGVERVPEGQSVWAELITPRR